MALVPPKRIPSLDGLRAMSILFVIVGHVWGGRGTPVFLSAFGVHVFFVLSGYLITRLLQNEYERNGRISLLAFYRRRCFRIFPAAFTYIALVAMFSPVGRTALIYAATYTISYHPTAAPPSFQHLWSLSVEEQFYLLWPFALILGFRRRACIAWMAMLTAAAFRLWVVSTSSLSIDYLHFSFFGTMDSIAAGCLLAIYEPRLRRYCAWMAKHTAIVIAVPLTAWVLVSALWATFSVLWGAVPLLIALWVLLLVERCDWILNNPVAISIGVLSYSLYLWQQPFTLTTEPALALRLAAVVVCAVGSYFLVERPMLGLGASLQAKTLRSNQPTTSVATTAQGSR